MAPWSVAPPPNSVGPIRGDEVRFESVSDSFFTFFREGASFVLVMRHLTKEEREALFPTTCHFKVIAVSIEGIHHLLNKALEKNGITDRKFQPSAQSKGGKYISYEIALELETHELMMRLDSDLRQIDGVKMVL
jgi:putative lipoic acid-binding regulatory protein